MTEFVNPYVIGPPVEGERFYGREDVFSFVIETMASARHRTLVLYGQRRMGKTSILKELRTRLPADLYHPVYFDLQGWAMKTLSDIRNGLAREIAVSLDLPVPESGTTQDGDLLQGIVLPMASDRLGGRRLVLLLDEFEVFSENQEDDPAPQLLFPYIQSLLASEENLAFVFAVGRRIEELPQWVRRMFKDAQYRSISLLRRQYAEQLIRVPVQGILTYNSAAIDAILDLTSGHPYITQLMCFEIFERLKRTKQSQATVDDVAAVIDRALITGNLAFAWLWDGLPPAGQILVSAIAHVTEGNASATEDRIRAELNRYRVRLPPDGWTNTPGDLVEWGILARDKEGGYCFVVELVRRWTLKQHSLQEVKLAQIHAMKQDFESAQRAYRAGSLSQAIASYRQILAANPNHAGAQLGLARALCDEDRLEEAVEAFQEAYWLDKIYGRDGLIEARLALGEQFETEVNFVEAAFQFRSVLELDPDNRQVEEKLRVLYDHGAKAEADHHWREAVSSFGRVTDIQPDYQDAAVRLERARYQSRRPHIAIVGGVIVLMLVLGVGGYFVWSEGAFPAPVVALIVTPATDAPNPTSVPSERPVPITQTSPIPRPTKTPTPTEATATPTPISPTGTPTKTPTHTSTPGPTATDTPIPPTATPVIIVVTATPTPIPAPMYGPVLVTWPPEGETFAGEEAPIQLQWEPIAPLEPNDWYAVRIRYIQNSVPTIGGNDLQDTLYQLEPEFYYHLADQPERRYEWEVTLIRKTIDAQGNEVVIPLSLPSETRTFYWQ